MSALTVLYRGPLSSCNYGCEYCPFAKRKETDAEHEVDAYALDRFVRWSLARTDPLKVFFTPWGEALTQVRYHEAMTRLSHAAHVERVAVQTNLSARLDWVKECRRDKLGIWATFHPAWTKRDRFLKQCSTLLGLGVRFSVGVVGFPEHADAVAALRAALPGEIYVWVNAVKKHPYAADEIEFFSSIDPHFRTNLIAHPSLGRSCRGGESVVSVDGEGTARRCHFIPTPIGNIYEPGFEAALRPRGCSNDSCGCHIGYVHLDYLELEKVYGSGLLERVPLHLPRASHVVTPAILRPP